ncbi:unnamed protein product, partial [Protopolystoma xenopodis]
MTDESVAPFYRNRKRLPRKQRQHECSSKSNRQLVKRNRPSSSGDGTDHRISSDNTSPRNGSELNKLNTASRPARKGNQFNLSTKSRDQS